MEPEPEPEPETEPVPIRARVMEPESVPVTVKEPVAADDALAAEFRFESECEIAARDGAAN